MEGADMARSNTPRQTAQSEPNPGLQADLTDPEQDRAEQHIVDESAPSAADERSAEAPGVRTEAEVIADHQADNERAAAALAENGHTADPAVSTSAVKLPRILNTSKLLHFKRSTDGAVQSVNEGSPAHRRLLTAAEWSETSAADAKDADTRTFARTAGARDRSRR